MSEQINVQWLPVAELKIDKRYQREVTPQKVTRMAQGWDDEAVDILVVSQREDGYYVIDGQHRLAAAKRAGVAFLRCEVLTDLSIERESDLFRIKNQERKTPTKLQMFKAMVIAGDPAALLVKSLAERSGLTIGIKDKDAIRCFSALHMFAKQQPEDLKRVWGLIVNVTAGAAIDERLVRALQYGEPRLAGGRSFSDPNIEKKLLKVGYVRIKQFITQASLGYARGSERVWVQGLLSAINHGVQERNHLRLKIEGES